MPTPPPPKDTKWKPGVSGNPGGKPKESKEVRAFKQSTYDDFIRKMNEFGHMTRDQLKQVIQDESTPVFDLVFGRILFDAQRGRQYAMNILIDRMWGKPKETTLDIPANAPKVVIQLPDNGRQNAT